MSCNCTLKVEKLYIFSGEKFSQKVGGEVSDMKYGCEKDTGLKQVGAHLQTHNEVETPKQVVFPYKAWSMWHHVERNERKLATYYRAQQLMMIIARAGNTQSAVDQFLRTYVWLLQQTPFIRILWYVQQKLFMIIAISTIH